MVTESDQSEMGIRLSKHARALKPNYDDKIGYGKFIKIPGTTTLEQPETRKSADRMEVFSSKVNISKQRKSQPPNVILRKNSKHKIEINFDSNTKGDRDDQMG